jgi:AcrR family transcriptional regulator
MSKRGTPELLITTAERMYALQGIDAVSLRQIAEAAGQRNPAVVQYHFATKAGLLRAIVEYRTLAANQERNAMLDELEAQGRIDDVHALLECAVYPLVGQLPEARNFIRFLNQVHAHSQLADIFWNLDDVHGSSGRRIARHLFDLLDALPVDVRVSRVRVAFQGLLGAISSQVTQEENDVEGLLPNDVFFADVINATTAFLQAPAPAIATSGNGGGNDTGVTSLAAAP